MLPGELLIVVRWFVRYLQRHSLEPFGLYRLFLSGALALLVLSGRRARDVSSRRSRPRRWSG